MLPIHVLGSPRLAAEVQRALPEHAVASLGSPDALAAALPEVAVLFAPFPPRTGWAAAGRLRLIQLLGSGVDQLLPSPDLPARVVVASLRGVMAAEVAEHACLMLLSLARQQPALQAQQAERRWKQRALPTLAERRVVLIGLGAIGGAIAERLGPFGCELVGVRRTARPHARVAQVVGPEELVDSLRPADALVVCAPRTPSTVGLIGPDAIAAISPGGLLVDVSRGGLVDEASALAALESGALSGVAKDVFDDEPLAAESAWWSAPSAIVTPHVAGYCEGYRERAIRALVENVGRLERGEAPLRQVDRAAGY